jgi:ribonuclease P protein component
VSAVKRCPFQPEHRLLTPRDFQAVFDNTQCKVVHPPFLMLIRANTARNPRLGLVFARKKVRLAVERNRLKRLVRTSFRLHQHELPAADVVFVARQGLDQLDNSAFLALLDKAWQQLNRRFRALPKPVASHENPAAPADPGLPVRP